MTPERSGRPEYPGAGSGHLLTVVVDDWATPPPPEPDRKTSEMPLWRMYRLDAMVAASGSRSSFYPRREVVFECVF